MSITPLAVRRLRRAFNRGINDYDASEETPLFQAVIAEDPITVEELLNKGAHPDKGRRDGETPLAWCCRNGRAQIGAMLLRAGANPDGKDAEGTSHLCLAVQAGNEELVRALTKAGANIVAGAPIAQALTAGRSHLAHAILETHAERDIDIVAASLPPASVMGAGAGQHLSIYKFRNDQRIEAASATDADGNAPVHLAAMAGDKSVLHRLACLPVDFLKENAAGKTPLDLARGCNREEAADFIADLIEKKNLLQKKRGWAP